MNWKTYQYAAIAGIIAIALIAGDIMLHGIGSTTTSEVVDEPVQDEAQTKTVYSRTQFEDLVRGKTKEQIIAILGNPGEVDGPSSGQAYQYSDLFGMSFAVRDDVTGLRYKFITIGFNYDGRENEVNY